MGLVAPISLMNRTYKKTEISDIREAIISPPTHPISILYFVAGGRCNISRVGNAHNSDSLQQKAKGNNCMCSIKQRDLGERGSRAAGIFLQKMCEYNPKRQSTFRKYSPKKNSSAQCYPDPPVLPIPPESDM